MVVIKIAIKQALKRRRMIIFYNYITNEMEEMEVEKAREFSEEYKMLFSVDTKLGHGLGAQLDDK